MMDVYTMRGTKVSVEAALVGVDDIDAIANWCGGQIVEEKDPMTDESFEALNLKTPTGRKRASSGDYVVKHGESFQVFSRTQFLAKFNAQPPISELAKNPANWRTKAQMQDPFEGMTRFNEGPKP